MAEAKKPTFEEVKAMVGQKKSEVLEVDRNMIDRFCQTIEDSSPKWKVQAPPCALTAAMFSGGLLVLGIPVPYKRTVAAGADWEYLKPIKPGDTITTVHEFAEIQDKSSEKGPRALLIFTSKHTNQKGEMVGVSTNTIMSY